MVTGAVEEMDAKYLFSAEGAKSCIREKLGIQMSYKEPQLVNRWGIIDARVSTIFQMSRYEVSPPYLLCPWGLILY